MDVSTKWRLLVACAALFVGTALVAQSDAADKEVGLVWIGKSGMTKRVASGFIQRLGEIAPQVRVVQRVQLINEQAAAEALNELEPAVDGLVFLRSTGAQFLAKRPFKKPAFVGGCSNPRELGVIRNLDEPEGNVTGVTYFIPYEKRFQVMKALFPAMKSLCLLAENGHPATPIEREGTRKECERLGIAYQEVIAANVRELERGMEAAADKVDLFVSAATRLTIDNTTIQAQVANAHKKPIFSYAEGRAKLGATAELAADDAKLGRMLAESVMDVVVKGKPVKEVPVKTDPHPELVINEALVKILGLSVPEAVLKKARLVQ
ncbi:MAG: ABC transporter substrate binding protein [Thermodesulfobacteriota bacterium]